MNRWLGPLLVLSLLLLGGSWLLAQGRTAPPGGPSLPELAAAQVEALRSIAAHRPDDAEPWLAIGSVYARRGLAAEAVEALEAALQREPGNVAALTGLQQVYGDVGYLDRQIEVLQDLIRTAPNLLPPYVELARLYRRVRWGADAREVLRRALAIDPDDEEVLLEQAVTLSAWGDYPAARQVAERLLTLNPHNHRAFSLLADTYAGQSNYDQALAQVKEAIRLVPYDAGYRWQLGHLRYLRPAPTRYADALPAFEKALELDPTHLAARYYLADCLLRLNRQEEAKQQLEWLARRAPDTEATALRLAEIYRREGRAEAAQQWERYYQIREAWNTRRLEVNNALHRTPRKAAIYLQGADLYWEGGGVLLAILEYKRGLEFDPGNQEAREKLVGALKAAGRTEEAREWEEGRGRSSVGFLSPSSTKGKQETAVH